MTKIYKFGSIVGYAKGQAERIAKLRAFFFLGRDLDEQDEYVERRCLECRKIKLMPKQNRRCDECHLSHQGEADL